ncbi:RNA polymerase sigma factor [Luteimonas sp. RC10]|uniref:RNA polymerase sigma factor n=1 Tax=Luteimonas sp. RC10 TaxID=2587035 RepID=UPI00160E1776|nr:RNA polymerase sigma factor [Luteimonas sp. RC10]MBB3342415.1 RNA polymerase sigma-70 factor (ECF subfamily) [Luteimonas sp. RC10]
MTAPAPGKASEAASPQPDERNVTRLAQHYRPALLRYFSRHLSSAEDAEDLTQDTLARLSQQPGHRLAGLANVEAFLMRIASNLLRDRFRRDRSHRASDHVPIEAVAAAWQSEEPSCECVYADKARLQQFLQALDALPPRCREVFLLQRYDGLTYSAVAKRLGISVSAVEKHMMRALMHLDATLDEA